MLHGRRAECALLDRLLADAANLRSGALLLRGEAGIGRTALLAYAADHAAGLVGGQSEAGVVLPAVDVVELDRVEAVGRDQRRTEQLQ